MKISALVGVKNEEELIERCIDHLFTIGVDDVIVEDYGSTDSTLEILKKYSSNSLKIVNFDESQDTNEKDWGNNEAAIIQSTGADWVLLLDADEFWLPRTGSIRDTLENSTASVITVNRYNVPLGLHGTYFPDALSPDFYAHMMCYVRGVDNLQGTLSTTDSFAWINGVPVPKIVVRPHDISRIAAGHHFAFDHNERRFPAHLTDDIVIAHLPFSSYDRFQRKVENIRQSIELQPSYHSRSTGWHWKRWIEIDNDGKLRSEFNRQIVSESDIHTLRTEGAVKSVSEILHLIEAHEIETTRDI